MNSIRNHPIRVAVAAGAAAAALFAALVIGGAFDDEASASGDAASGIVPSGLTEVTGVVAAAYVDPPELAVEVDGDPRSLPVAGDVAVIVEGEVVEYDAFTLSFEDGGPTSTGGAATYTVFVDGEGFVVRIER